MDMQIAIDDKREKIQTALWALTRSSHTLAIATHSSRMQEFAGSGWSIVTRQSRKGHFTVKTGMARNIPTKGADNSRRRTTIWGV